MKLNNKKGFTLIELLAVIVILAILLAIAIPNVAKYINSARKSTFIENVQQYAQAAKHEIYALNSEYQLPVNKNDATVITFNVLKDAIENGGKTSPYGGEWDSNSYIIIVNTKSAEEPKYDYYIAAIDTKGYGVGDNKTAAAIGYEDLKEKHILQLGSNGISYADAAAGKFCVRYAYTGSENDGALANAVGTCEVGG